MDILNLIPTIIVGILMFGIYFLPSFVAYHRGHKDKLPLLIVNFFLGWTGIFWVLALAWGFLHDSALPATEGAAVKRGGFGKFFFIVIILLVLMVVANAYLMQGGTINGLLDMSSISMTESAAPVDQAGVPVSADDFLSGQ